MAFDYISILKMVPAAVTGLTIHEFAHAYTCYRLGDLTAKEEGRLTLNPLKHIDPLSFLLTVIAGFGWAKPVHFKSENFKNKHRDEILVSLAGPISNLLLGLAFLIIARLFYFFPFFNQTDFGLGVVNLIVLWGVVNFGLFVFNLIPIPPLDGSHLYTTFLKEINPKLLSGIYSVGTVSLFTIIIIQNRLKFEIIPISQAIGFITDICISLLGFKH